MSKFIPGQVWAYHTRPGEDGSCVTVLRVDATAHARVIVHVAVEGISIRNPSDHGRPTRTIGFMPIAEASLDGSITSLITTKEAFVPSADFENGSPGWKEAFDSGKAGFWTAPVAKVVQSVEDGLQKTR